MVAVDFVVRCFVGMCSGLMVSGALFALITTLGIINRFQKNTKTARKSFLYEQCVIWGAFIGNIIFVLDINIPIKTYGCIIFGLMGGIYAGTLAIALAEVIKTIPVFIQRTRLTSGFGAIILSMGIGKSIGTLIYFLVLNY